MVPLELKLKNFFSITQECVMHSNILYVLFKVLFIFTCLNFDSRHLGLTKSNSIYIFKNSIGK